MTCARFTILSHPRLDYIFRHVCLFAQLDEADGQKNLSAYRNSVNSIVTIRGVGFSHEL
jgi:hypothetical protein